MASIKKPRSAPSHKRPNQGRLRQLFSYEPETGLLYRIGHCNSKHGTAGSISSNGHMQVYADGKLYQLHNIIWVMMTGNWPSHDLDHRNQNRTDNRWINLREATRSQNAANRKHAGSASGVKGVHQRASGRYRAVITHNYIKRNLGTFSTIAEAASAYATAAATLFGEFAFTGHQA